MFPWVPFFVFSQQSSSHRRTKHQPNLFEEMLEVRAVGANVEKLHHGPSYQMLYRLTTTNQSKPAAILLPKTPMQHIKIEFDTTETRKQNPSSDHEEYDGFITMENRCSTIASSSSSSTSNESKVQNGDCGHHSPTPSVKKSSPAELSDNAIAQTKTFRRRTAFETSEAMREIFGASPFSSQQKENLGEVNREKRTAENRKTTIENQQNNKREIRLSELEDDVENRDFDNLSEVSVQDGVAQIVNERPVLENGVTKMNNRRRSDNRISPAISGSWERTSRPAMVNWHQSAGPSSVGWRSAANPPGAAVCWYCGVKGHVAVHCRKMRRKGQ